MARTAITAQAPAVGGTVVTAEAANVAGNSVLMRTGAKYVLVVINGGVGSITVTLQTPGVVSGLAIADRTVSVGAGVTKHILLDDVLKRGDDDYAYVDYSGVTTVTVYVLQV